LLSLSVAETCERFTTADEIQFDVVALQQRATELAAKPEKLQTSDIDNNNKSHLVAATSNNNNNNNNNNENKNSNSNGVTKYNSGNDIEQAASSNVIGGNNSALFVTTFAGQSLSSTALRRFPDGVSDLARTATWHSVRLVVFVFVVVVVVCDNTNTCVCDFFYRQVIARVIELIWLPMALFQPIMNQTVSHLIQSMRNSSVFIIVDVCVYSSLMSFYSSSLPSSLATICGVSIFCNANEDGSFTPKDVEVVLEGRHLSFLKNLFLLFTNNNML
jgi:hypothetical protein